MLGNKGLRSSEERARGDAHDAKRPQQLGQVAREEVAHDGSRARANCIPERCVINLAQGESADVW